ncbi:MAG: adenosylcobinamide amidohydrolase [Deltaproteobacteria bacterium]|jgi:adenosylcobinamide amidohydrolase|nr:adenosylcobinamide amidohydrolase [Deltaproteobacteria bacterium]
MLLGKFYDGVEIYRGEKIIYGKLLSPHLVVSTCRSGGGLRSDLAYLGNHQSCEPAGHSHGGVAAIEPDAYHGMICSEHSIPPDKCALLGTAANMRLAAIKQLSFRDLTVVAAVTAGVEGNAGRAGDPAWGWEGPDGYEPLRGPGAGSDGAEDDEEESRFGDPEGPKEEDPLHGTINTLIFISLPLTPGALVRTIMTATEAKTAALEELGVNSRYSDRPATGTGTDQIGVAAMTSGSRRPLTSAGKHSKLGELIALCAAEALKEVLARQNGMTTERQRSVRILLERFHQKPDGRYGLEIGRLLDMIAANLDQGNAELMRENHRGLIHDPMVVAQVAAMVHLRDKFQWKILPWSVYAEVMSRQAALLAVEAGGRLDRFGLYYEEISRYPPGDSNQAFLALAAKAMAMGFADKWPKR